MKRLLQINSTANWGSTGRIAEGIGEAAMEAGWESYVAYGRQGLPGKSRVIKIGGKVGQAWHLAQTRVLDRHGLGSVMATRAFVREIEELGPDVIHLHNIHGYYLNYPILFDWLRRWGGPVVWTLHDCWAFTGHCAHFVTAGCGKWKTNCGSCPLKGDYPGAWLADRSAENFREKKAWFTSVGNMTVVTVSDWMKGFVRESFLGKYPIRRIWNGVDTVRFAPGESAEHNWDYVLGVASVWTEKKGLGDFVALRSVLPREVGIVLVGLTAEQIRRLPAGITGIQRTDSVEELRGLYAGALAFVNPTWEDNFPTTNLEALACGTPVITYRTGGSVEAVDAQTGYVVEQGDVAGLAAALGDVRRAGWGSFVSKCRERAVRNFDRRERSDEYVELYNTLMDNKLNKNLGGVRFRLRTTSAIIGWRAAA